MTSSTPATASTVPIPISQDLDPPGSVAVDIVGYRVCTLSGPEGERYRRFLASTGRGGMASCDALVTGGWLREEGEGYFAVHLDLAWPLRFHEDVPLERAA